MCFCVPTLLLTHCKHCSILVFASASITEEVVHVHSRVGHAHKLNLEFSVNKLNEHSLFIGITGIRLRI